GARTGCRPDRREERHAVPNLDQRVARAVPTHNLAEGRAREHQVPARLADDPVTVSPADLSRSGRVRRSHRHFDAGLPPERGDPRRVQLRPTGLRIVDVAPRKYRDATETRGRRDFAELRNAADFPWVALV